jgi:hypothetical protein
VFPVDAVVLLVKTDDVLCVLGSAIGIDENTIEILAVVSYALRWDLGETYLDNTQAITAEG